jgi:hypothetical protein
MTPEVAKAVHRFFDQEALTAYVEERITQIHQSMEGCTPDFLPSLQGAITELRRLLKAKEHAENTLKVIKNG